MFFQVVYVVYADTGYIYTVYIIKMIWTQAISFKLMYLRNINLKSQYLISSRMLLVITRL